MRRILAMLVMLTENEASSFSHVLNDSLFTKEDQHSIGESHNA
ncbi:hypothetical protein [Colwellia sp. 75C3]|nr:hypothetical protein [Colwellia sp. 75C3]